MERVTFVYPLLEKLWWPMQTMRRTKTKFWRYRGPPRADAKSCAFRILPNGFFKRAVSDGFQYVNRRRPTKEILQTGVLQFLAPSKVCGCMTCSVFKKSPTRFAKEASQNPPPFSSGLKEETKHKARRAWGQVQTSRGTLPCLIQTGEFFSLRFVIGLDLFWLGGSRDICKTKTRRSNTSHL